MLCDTHITLLTPSIDAWKSPHKADDNVCIIVHSKGC